MESDLIKQKPRSLHPPHAEACSTSSTEYVQWISTNLPGELFISVHDLGSGAMLFKRKIQLYFPFLNIFAAAMPFLHVPEELKVSRVQLHLLSAGYSQHFLPVCWVHIRSQLGSPASPSQCRAPGAWPGAAAGKQQGRGGNLHMGVVFLSPWGCAWQLLLAGPPAPWGNGDGISSSWDLPCWAPVHFWHLPEHDPCCQRYPWSSSRFSPSSGWVHSLFFCLMVKKICILFFILVSLAHAAEGGRGSFWRRGRGGLIDDPGWRWRAGWRAASCRTAVWALPGRKGLEHSATSFLEHLLLQKQSEKMSFE